MPIKVIWHNTDRTILRWEFDEHWNWEEYATAQYQSNEMIEQVEYDRVDVIGDVRRSHTLPMDAILGYRNSLKNQSSRIGSIVLVGTNRFVKSMVKIFMKYYPSSGRRFKFADSFLEAEAMVTSSHEAQKHQIYQQFSEDNIYQPSYQ